MQNVPGTFQRRSLRYKIWCKLLICCLEYIVSPARHVTRIPEQLSPDTAAPLLCGMSSLSVTVRWILRDLSGNRHVFFHHEDQTPPRELPCHSWCRRWPRTHVCLQASSSYQLPLLLMILLNRGIQIACKKGLKVIAIDRFVITQFSSIPINAH